MCGRYALSLRPAIVRQWLEDQDMPVDEAPADDDEQLRQSYNFAPGYHGLIYRAATSDRGAEASSQQHERTEGADDEQNEPSPKRTKLSYPTSSSQTTVDGRATQATRYKLQAAKWGLIPFWTKRPPDYGSQLRTINCRDDSLLENRGMWNTMKQRKRCIVVCEGFYEWLKKNNGKEKIPHFVKRKDGGLMCFAGLWDMVQYEGSEERLYTYTVVTTDSNKQLRFLHDRMPVILEPGSEQMKCWLDPQNVGWSKELQGMLKPFQGELEFYPVDKGVGKVGNNSPLFVVPVDSKENKKNIANFFGKQEAAAKSAAEKKKEVQDVGDKIKHEDGEVRETKTKVEGTEDNAPLPVPPGDSAQAVEHAIKREQSDLSDVALNAATDGVVEDAIEAEPSEVKDEVLEAAAKSPLKVAVNREPSQSPVKKSAGTKRTRSATSNGTVAKAATKDGDRRITSFFGK